MENLNEPLQNPRPELVNTPANFFARSADPLMVNNNNNHTPEHTLNPYAQEFVPGASNH